MPMSTFEKNADCKLNVYFFFYQHAIPTSSVSVKNAGNFNLQTCCHFHKMLEFLCISQAVTTLTYVGHPLLLEILQHLWH